MSDGRRPGGLTALAVLNFVFGGLGALGLLLILAALKLLEGDSEGSELREVVGASRGVLWAHLLFAMVTVGLMITSGVGYLGQKRFLGRTLGNAYAVCSVAATALALSYSPFEIGTLVGLVYPLLTLMLLNTTFKDDLVL